MKQKVEKHKVVDVAKIMDIKLLDRFKPLKIRIFCWFFIKFLCMLSKLAGRYRAVCLIINRCYFLENFININFTKLTPSCLTTLQLIEKVFYQIKGIY